MGTTEQCDKAVLFVQVEGHVGSVLCFSVPVCFSWVLPLLHPSGGAAESPEERAMMMHVAAACWGGVGLCDPQPSSQPVQFGDPECHPYNKTQLQR